MSGGAALADKPRRAEISLILGRQALTRTLWDPRDVPRFPANFIAFGEKPKK